MKKMLCVLNDEACQERVRDEVIKLITDTWAYTLKSEHNGKTIAKQRKINLGMKGIIKTALGDYAPVLFNQTLAAFHAEGQSTAKARLHNAFVTGADSVMSPDSFLAPNFAKEDGASLGHAIAFLYKMAMLSIHKNLKNRENNLVGEATAFFLNDENKDNHLAIIDVVPNKSLRKMGKKVVWESIPQAKNVFSALNMENENPESLGYKLRNNLIAGEIRYDWHPDIEPAVMSLKDLYREITQRGAASVVRESITLDVIKDLTAHIIESYDLDKSRHFSYTSDEVIINDNDEPYYTPYPM